MSLKKIPHSMRLILFSFLYWLILMHLVIEDTPLMAMAHQDILNICIKLWLITTTTPVRANFGRTTYQVGQPNQQVAQDLFQVGIRVLHRENLVENYSGQSHVDSNQIVTDLGRQSGPNYIPKMKGKDELPGFEIIPFSRVN